MAEFHEQTVEIALGPKGAFENGTVGTMTRRVRADRVVNTAAKSRRSAKPLRKARTPRVVELLRNAQEWRRQLDAGEVVNQAEIARREGITRARVTQVLAMLRLAPEIQQQVLSLPEVLRRPMITERALRPIAHLDSATDQMAKFQTLIEVESWGPDRITAVQPQPQSPWACHPIPDRQAHGRSSSCVLRPTA